MDEINKKIKNGDVYVLTVEEMKKLIDESGEEVAFKEIDVVTTATFGPMCSSGAFLNFGHSDPPIKLAKAWLNDVEVYTGNAAVDCYLGATKPSVKQGIKYGGGHVIEELVSGKEIELKAIGQGTDCYPRKTLTYHFTIHDLNQAFLVNPRNSYQKYLAATNSSDKTIYTYLGPLLPNFGNVNYAGCGCINPLINDPNYETIGLGTRIFLGGGTGYVIGEGTQHNPKQQQGTLFVKGNLKKMAPEYLKGVSFYRYAPSLAVGIGIPIPILHKGIVKNLAIKDEEIWINLVDYSVPSRVRPILKKVNYKELKKGVIEVKGEKVRTGSTSSLFKARKIMVTLKKWVEEGLFTLTKPVNPLPKETKYAAMKRRV